MGAAGAERNRTAGSVARASPDGGRSHAPLTHKKLTRGNAQGAGRLPTYSSGTPNSRSPTAMRSRVAGSNTSASL